MPRRGVAAWGGQAVQQASFRVRTRHRAILSCGLQPPAGDDATGNSQLLHLHRPQPQEDTRRESQLGPHLRGSGTSFTPVILTWVGSVKVCLLPTVQTLCKLFPRPSSRGGGPRRPCFIFCSFDWHQTFSTLMPPVHGRAPWLGRRGPGARELCFSCILHPAVGLQLATGHT